MSEIYDIHSHSGVQRHNLYHENREMRVMSVPELLRRYGDRIDKVVNFPMPGTVYFNYDGRPSSEYGGHFPYEVENTQLLNAVETHDREGKILPFLCVDPRVQVTEQVEGLYGLLKNHKVFGLKFHTLDTQASIHDLFGCSELMSLCREYQLPVIIHSGDYENEEDCNSIFEHAKQHRDINFCVAHLMTFSRLFFSQMRAYPHKNVFTDVSPFLSLCKYVSRVKPKRAMSLDYDNPVAVIETLFRDYSDVILWGSDEPFGNFKIDDETNADFSLEEEIDFLFSLNPTIRSSIASKNSERFLFGKTRNQAIPILS